MNDTSISIAHNSATAERAELARRLFRLSVGVRALVLIGALALLAWCLTLLLAPAAQLLPMLQQSDGALLRLMQGEFSDAVRWRLAAAASLPMLVGLGLLWQLWYLFGHFQRGQVLVPAAVQRLRRFGRLLVLLAVAEPVSRALSSVAVSWDNPPGKRMLEVSLSSQDYTLLLLALVLVAVARVMAEAVRLAEENDAFV